MQTRPPAEADRPGRRIGWWSRAAGYEVYLRSFADGDGDGVGDLPGLIDRLPYLAWLGIDVVWVTPFYLSPMADHGYDVSDHTAVDPAYGTLDDVDRLVAGAHDLGLRLVIDLVPNHTSSAHPWFQAALRDRADPRRDYYIWRDPARGGGPPNNWVSFFGGPAWTLDPASGQYWLHLFLPEQPDLNWANPAVAGEFDAILSFWLERGVDGFRVDVAHALAKDPLLRDNPRLHPPVTPGDPRSEFAAFDHRHDLGRPETLAIFRRWRDLAAAHDAVLLGEVYLEDPARIGRYVEGDGLDLAFTFGVLRVDWTAPSLRRTLAAIVASSGPGACWIQGSHDESRVATRLGGGERGRRRALALATLLAGLPGALFLYQGDELGLEDGAVPTGSAADPMATRNPAGAGGRDGCRTPMPWRPGPGLGFSPPGVATWLPASHAAADTVEAQRDDPFSPLQRHRRLLRARAALPAGEVEWRRPASDDDPVVAYRRGDVVVAANVGEAAAALVLPPGRWVVAVRSSGDPGDAGEPAPATIAPDDAVILHRHTRRGGDRWPAPV